MGIRWEIRSPEDRGPYGLKSPGEEQWARSCADPWEPTSWKKEAASSRGNGVKERMEGSVTEAWKHEDRGRCPPSDTVLSPTCLVGLVK